MTIDDRLRETFSSIDPDVTRSPAAWASITRRTTQRARRAAWTRRAGIALVPVVAVAALAIVLVNHSDNAQDVSSAGEPSEPIRWDSLGSGSWEGARTASGGRDILIVLVGGPEYDPDNPCSAAYHVEVTETSTQVRLRLGESSPADRRPPPPPGSVYGCANVGYTRYVTAHLAQPLGTRQVIEAQFDRVQPVFDGDALATVGRLPDGWHQRLEAPARFGDHPLGWFRKFGPDRSQTDNRCTPAEAGIGLSETPANAGTQPPATGDDVHRTKATYSHDEQGARLVWTEHGRLYVVTSETSCKGDTIPSKDTLLHFARSLDIR